MTIEEVAAFFGKQAKDFVKTLLYNVDGKIVAFCIPGDRELNETKALKLLHANEMELASFEDVEKVTIRSNRIVKQLVDNSHPKNPYGAKFSIQYCVATMIKYGKLGIDQFVDENLNNDEIQRVMQNIEVIVDPQLDKEYTEKPDRWAVELTIACKDGKTYTKFVEYPKGDPPNPMTWDETVEKFMDLSVPVYGEEVCKKLVNLVATLDEHDNFKKALAECF